MRAIVVAWVAIGVIVVAVGRPILARRVAMGRGSACVSNLKVLNVAISSYCMDYDERFPLSSPVAGAARPALVRSQGEIDLERTYAPGDWRRRIAPYLKERSVFLCPQTREADSYVYNTALTRTLYFAARDKDGLVSLYDRGFERGTPPPPHLGGYNVGFAAGHVKWVAGSAAASSGPSQTPRPHD